MSELGKALIALGAILIGIGLLFIFASKVPFLGRLPGDFFIQRKNFSFYFPLATSLLVSIIFSLIFWLLSRR